MTESFSTHITGIAEFELLQSFEAFQAASAALVARNHQEGLRGVIDYRYFRNPQTDGIGAVFTYADAETWIAHHKLIVTWPEFEAYKQTVRMVSYTLYGPVNDTIREMGSTAPFAYRYFSEPVAGFVRD